jgi:hypothetical protein
MTLLEERQDFLGGLNGIASDDAELLHAQLEVARFDRHAIIMARSSDEPTDLLRRPSPEIPRPLTAASGPCG